MNMGNNKNGKSTMFKTSSLVILIFVATTASLVLWLVNTVINLFKTTSGEPVSALRWLSCVLISLTVAGRGLKKGSLSTSGAIFGFFVGMVTSMGSFIFTVCLLTMFISSSLATKFRSSEKKKLEYDFKEGGQRNWVQVLCNGGMAASCSLFYILDCGCGELPIDFANHYRASHFALGVLGSLAAANGDTWASELGAVMSKSNPFLITTFKRVPKGTNGGVSFWGLIFSAAGGLVVGLNFFIAGWVISEIFVYSTCGTDVNAAFHAASPQWPSILLATASGFIGSLIDSILGATLQYSGLNTSGVIVEHPGKDIKHISGIGILDNHSVNLLTTIIMGFITSKMGYLFWP